MKYIKATAREFSEGDDRSYNAGVEDISFIRCMNHRQALEMLNENAAGDECGLCAHITGFQKGELARGERIQRALFELSQNWRKRCEIVLADPDGNDDTRSWAKGLRQAAIELERYWAEQNTKSNENYQGS